MSGAYQSARKKHERTVALVHRLVKKWKRRLWLSHWTINTAIEWNGLEPNNVAARTHADWRYLEADISWSVPLLSTMSPAAIEKVVVHELVHVHLNEMREGDIRHEERVTTMLTEVIMALAP